MIRYASLLLIISLVFGSCLGRKAREENPVTGDSSSAPTGLTAAVPVDTTEYASEDMQNECVFDTSTYEFTTDKLKQYQADISYQWDSRQAQARTVLSDGDTLWLHIGGCNHFGYSAALGTAVPFEDSAALMNKARWVALTFLEDVGEKYDEMIAQEQFQSGGGSIPGKIRMYDVIVSDTVVTAYIYDGFSFARKGTRTRIEIMGYIN